MAAFLIADPGAAFCVLEQNGVPSVESIERWRTFVLEAYRKSMVRGDGSPRPDDERTEFLNRIFDYALLGRDKHTDIRTLARKELSAMLKSLAKQVATNGNGRNIKAV